MRESPAACADSLSFFSSSRRKRNKAGSVSPNCRAIAGTVRVLARSIRTIFGYSRCALTVDFPGITSTASVDLVRLRHGLRWNIQLGDKIAVFVYAV